MATTLSLNDRQRKALEDICDAFCPSGEGLPSARELGVPDALVEAIAGQTARDRAPPARRAPVRLGQPGDGLARRRRDEQLQLARAAPARARAARMGRLAAAPAPRRSSRRSARARCSSTTCSRVRTEGGPGVGRDRLRRPARAARRRAAEGPYHDRAGPRRATRMRRRNRRLGRGRRCSSGRARGSRPRRDRGRGGRLLRRPGLRGLPSSARSPASTWALRTRRHDQSVALLAGACLGGGTVVNYTTSFRTPRRRARRMGGTRGPGLCVGRIRGQPRRGLRPARRQPGVQRSPRRASRSSATGCTALGWHIDAMPRGFRQCAMGKECGYCGSGAASAQSSRSSRRGSRTRTRPARGWSCARVWTALLLEGGAARGNHRHHRRRQAADDPLACGRRRVRRDPHACTAQALGAREHRTSAAIFGCIRRPPCSACSTRS